MRRSGLTLRLVVERYVSIDWTRRRVRENWTRHRVRDKLCSWRPGAPVPHFIGEVRGSWRRFDLFISRVVCNLHNEIVKFKLSIVMIRNSSGLLRAALQLIVQNDGLRDFPNGLAHLLAL